MRPSAPLHPPSRLAALSFLTLILSWALILISRRAATITTAFDPVRTMVALLWAAAALALTGLILAILAMRTGSGSRSLALGVFLLNSLTMGFFLVVAFLAILIGS